MAKRNEYLADWESVQRGLDPGESQTDRVLDNIRTKRFGWHRTRGRFAPKADWKPPGVEFGWAYTPEAAHFPSVWNPETGQPEVSPEQRTAISEWEQRSQAMHEKQRADMIEWVKHQSVFGEFKDGGGSNPDPYLPQNIGKAKGEAPAYHEIYGDHGERGSPGSPVLKRGD